MSAPAPVMASWNLALRFALEVAALIGLVVGARSLVGGFGGWLLGGAVVAVVLVVWGTFNVPGDPSRSGRAPVPVPGVLRLCIELDVFVFGGVGLMLGSVVLGVVFFVLVVVHLVASVDRLRWLVVDRSAPNE